MAICAQGHGGNGGQRGQPTQGACGGSVSGTAGTQSRGGEGGRIRPHQRVFIMISIFNIYHSVPVLSATHRTNLYVLRHEQSGDH